VISEDIFMSLLKLNKCITINFFCIMGVLAGSIFADAWSDSGNTLPVLKGDFTLTYLDTHQDVRPLEDRQALIANNKRYLNWLVSQGQMSVSSEAAALAGLEPLANIQNKVLSITISSHKGILYYACKPLQGSDSFNQQTTFDGKRTRWLFSPKSISPQSPINEYCPKSFCNFNPGEANNY
jgi:hypothetical protein